ncbi:MAG: hypothetical protein QOD06_1748 [Candidatus Binatota bacterium]|jgi:hypothetical protein|nr:hypothetical protein [Candidatus Binatota bacterium]
MSNWKAITVLGCAVAVLAPALQADAADVRVRCERRANRRSKISVDGRNLARGQYRAIVKSGSNKATSPAQPAVGGEAEFDFDSDRGDIAEGATAISPTFIQGGKVLGKIRNSAGTIVAQASATCEIR